MDEHSFSWSGASAASNDHYPIPHVEVSFLSLRAGRQVKYRTDNQSRIGSQSWGRFIVLPNGVGLPCHPCQPFRRMKSPISIGERLACDRGNPAARNLARLV